LTKRKVYVAGHLGMVGSAICRQLLQNDSIKLITATRNQLDLTCQISVFDFFKNTEIDEVFLAAAKVVGIFANNTYPAEYIYNNIIIQTNVINAAHKANIQKILFLGSSCIYPKNAKQPMSEDTLLSGTLEPTNEPYAIAKIAGIKICESFNRQYGRDYRSVMPSNLYGPGDSFHPENSHVVPALIRRFHEAKVKNKRDVIVWGSGKPMREFLHVNDMASGSIHVMNLENKIYKKNTKPMLSHINIGTGLENSIEDLTKIIKKVVGYEGNILWDISKPDGSKRKLMDISLITSLGWKPKTKLEDGIKDSYQWYLNNCLSK